MPVQIGNPAGVAARGGNTTQTAMATVTANPGANQVTVSAADLRKFRVGQFVDIWSAAGALRAYNVQITAMNNVTNIMTYSGADVPAIANTDLIYDNATNGQSAPSNINGGTSLRRGFDLGSLTLAGIRHRLYTINPTYYSEARLNTMSYNDMLYALRVHDAPSSI